jgi:cell division inhibitor SepF
MAERLKRAAAWLGLVTDDRYGEEDDRNGAPHEAYEHTEGLSRDELMAQSASSNGASTGASSRVTTLESKRTSNGHNGHSGTSSSNSGAGHANGGPNGSTVVTHAPASSPRTADMSRIITVHPRTYNEARTIGEHFRDGVPVIMNLSEMEDVDAKRLVDFAAGLIFGLRGTIERVTSKVFLLSPHNVNVAAEDKERIAGGFFNQS